jgi:hypothetical protein
VNYGKRQKEKGRRQRAGGRRKRKEKGKRERVAIRLLQSIDPNSWTTAITLQGCDISLIQELEATISTIVASAQ